MLQPFRLRHTLTLLSLLLAIITVALWARASRHQDAVSYDTPRATNGLFSGQGRIVFHRAHGPRAIDPDTLGFSYQHLRMEPSRWFLPASLGFGFVFARNVDGPMSYTGVAIPYWFITLALLILPLRGLLRSQRLRRRERLGQCLHCGYDLRFSPIRCPECGAEPIAGSLSKNVVGINAAE